MVSFFYINKLSALKNYFERFMSRYDPSFEPCRGAFGEPF